MMPTAEPQQCCVCRGMYQMKSLRLIRHSYGKRSVYNYVCAPCAENVARSRSQAEEARGV